MTLSKVPATTLRSFQQVTGIGAFGGLHGARHRSLRRRALGSRGSRAAEPTPTPPRRRGFHAKATTCFAPLFADALRRGIQIETYAIGDKANRSTEFYEKTFSAVPVAERKAAELMLAREHAQIVDPVDIARFAKLGVIPSMQPSARHRRIALRRQATSAPRGPTAPTLGVAFSLRVRSSPEGATRLSNEGKPLIEFYAAVARRDLKGFQGDGWHPEQAMTRAEALKALTLWPAVAAFEEKDRGSIEVGKVADLTVLC